MAGSLEREEALLFHDAVGLVEMVKKKINADNNRLESTCTR